jgi:hypothetical protein
MAYGCPIVPAAPVQASHPSASQGRPPYSRQIDSDSRNPPNAAATTNAVASRNSENAGERSGTNRRATGPGTAHYAKRLDVTMMTQVGGRERTEAEYARLLERAGWEVAETWVPEEGPFVHTHPGAGRGFRHSPQQGPPGAPRPMLPYVGQPL